MSDERLAALIAELESNAPQEEGLGEITLEEAASTLDPGDPKTIAYYGVRVEKSLAQTTERVSSRGLGKTTHETAVTVGAMVKHLTSFTPESVGKPPSFFQRLLGGGAVKDAVTKFRAVSNELDKLATTLEGQTSALLADALTLERLESTVRERVLDIATYVRAGMPFVNDDSIDESIRYDLAVRIRDLLTARVIGGQGLATMQVMRANIQRLLERIRSLLNGALPLWRQQTDFALQIAARIERGKALDAALTDVTAPKDLSGAARDELVGDLKGGADPGDVITKVRDKLAHELAETNKAAEE